MPTAADIIVLGGGVEDMGLVVPNKDGYLGCIDRVVVNNEQLSLLLPNERSPIVTVCGPRYAYTQYPQLLRYKCSYVYMQSHTRVYVRTCTYLHYTHAHTL